MGIKQTLLINVNKTLLLCFFVLKKPEIKNLILVQSNFYFFFFKFASYLNRESPLFSIQYPPLLLAGPNVTEKGTEAWSGIWTIQLTLKLGALAS